MNHTIFTPIVMTARQKYLAISLRKQKNSRLQPLPQESPAARSEFQSANYLICKASRCEQELTLLVLGATASQRRPAKKTGDSYKAYLLRFPCIKTKLQFPKL